MRKSIVWGIVLLMASSLFATGTIGGGIGIPMVSASYSNAANREGMAMLAGSLEMHGSNEFARDGKFGHGIGYSVAFGIGTSDIGVHDSTQKPFGVSTVLDCSFGYQGSYQLSDKDIFFAGFGCSFSMPTIRTRVTASSTTTDTTIHYFLVGPYVELGSRHAFSSTFTLSYGVTVGYPLFSGINLRSVVKTTGSSTETINTASGICSYPKGMTIVPSVSAVFTY